MKMTKVVNKYKEDYDVYIGMGSQFGNPFSTKESKHSVHLVSTKEEAIEKYREMWLKRLHKHPEHTKKLLLTLNGKKLGCFCSPKACHGDVLVELIDLIKEGVY